MFSFRQNIYFQSSLSKNILPVMHIYLTSVFVSFNFCASRPTAVNLSDAATKLQTLVSKMSETAKDAKAIFQVLT
jgi:methylthioribose-1-phosphate isomerase